MTHSDSSDMEMYPSITMWKNANKRVVTVSWWDLNLPFAHGGTLNSLYTKIVSMV